MVGSHLLMLWNGHDIPYCNVKFGYLVNGKNFTGQRTNLDPNEVPKSLCESLTKREPQRNVTVYFNSKCPPESSLSIHLNTVAVTYMFGISSFVLTCRFGGLFLLLVAIYCVFSGGMAIAVSVDSALFFNQRRDLLLALGVLFVFVACADSCCRKTTSTILSLVACLTPTVCCSRLPALRAVAM